jgi:hypothetical protein
MSAVSVQQMASRVAQLMEERLRIKGDTLVDKLRRGGRLLPRKVRRQAEFLAVTAMQAQNPKLQMQIDSQRTADAYDACVRFLKPLGQGARRRAILLHFVVSLATILIVTFVMVVAVLVWRGFL